MNYPNKWDSGAYQPPPPAYTPPPSYLLAPYKRPLRRWANVIGVSIVMIQVLMQLIYQLLILAFSFVDLGTLRPETLDLLDQSSMLVSYLLSFWIPVVFIAAMIKIPAHVAFPMRRVSPSLLLPAVFVCLGMAMVGSMATGVVTVICETVFGVTPTMPAMSIPAGVGANIVYIISMSLAPAIFEELLFRGVVLQSLRRFGDGFALVTSSLLFALCHNNLIQGPNTFLMGLAMGYFVLRSGSLVTGMVIHLVNNGLAVLFSYLMDNMTDQAAELLNAGVFAGYLLLGAGALVFLAVRYGNLFRLIPSDYPLPESKKYATFFLSVGMLLCLAATFYWTSFYFV